MTGEDKKLRLHESRAAEESRDGYRSRNHPRSNIAEYDLAPWSAHIILAAWEGII